MKTRQAILKTAGLLFSLFFSACSQAVESLPTQTSTPVTSSPTATFLPSPIPATSTPMLELCKTQPGRIEGNFIPDTKPPQEFLIYLPPCYAELTDNSYPVIYLLHGQTFTQDQWVRLGAASIADQLIRSEESDPFILVFPDDRYWNLPAGAGFGIRLINDIIPYVDKTYRTLDDREHRSLGGLSRGGGWTAFIGFNHPELFNSLGLHSPAIFQDNGPFLEKIIKDIPEEIRPRLWLDIGDADKELGSGRLLEEVFTRTDYLHEFHLFSGDHTEMYWSAHVDEYLRWYARAWQEPAGQ